MHLFFFFLFEVLIIRIVTTFPLNAVFIKQIRGKIFMNETSKVSMCFGFQMKVTRGNVCTCLFFFKIKSRFLFAQGFLLPFPLHCAHNSCSVRQCLCLSSCHWFGRINTMHPLCPIAEIWYRPKSTPVFCKDFTGAFVQTALFKITTSFKRAFCCVH